MNRYKTLVKNNFFSMWNDVSQQWMALTQLIEWNDAIVGFKV